MRLASFVAVLFLAACSTIQSDENIPINYGCNDVVVLGRAKTLSYYDVTSEGDILGHSAFEIEISISKVLFGTESRKVVPASFVAHSFIREDKKLVFVLSPEKDGYRITNLSLWGYRPRPRLAESCDPS